MFITKKYMNMLIERLEGKFEKVDQRFEKIDQRFESIEAKMATKDDLKSFATKDDIHELKEKLATWMVKHFYTKDEIDKKFTTLETKVNDGIISIKAIYEGIRHDFKAVGEGHGSLRTKVENHEERITHLETS